MAPLAERGGNLDAFESRDFSGRSDGLDAEHLAVDEAKRLVVRSDEDFVTCYSINPANVRDLKGAGIPEVESFEVVAGSVWRKEPPRKSSLRSIIR
jgi:hypothetical protein